MVLVILFGVAVLTGWGWYSYAFPYGWSHCCSIGLSLDLHMYAEDHNGHFPSGMATPEASLGLLYDGTNDYMFDLLRGKTVPIKVTRAALKNGRLGPESCGWHYVEGLTESDDPQIAIVWDKIGLGHNGERLKNGAHEVIFVDGSRKFIPATGWSGFLERQKRLLANRDPQEIKGIPGLVATIRLSTGQVLNHYDGNYELASIEIYGGGSGHGTVSGNNLSLCWYRYTPDGQITLTLTLPSEHLRSKPVSFEVKNGRASPSSIVFEMEKY